MSKNVKVWLMGGFGNVLFQILAFNVLKKNGNKVSFVSLLTEKNFLTKAFSWTIHQRLYDDLISTDQIEKQGITFSLMPMLIAFLTKKLFFFNRYAFFYQTKFFENERVASNVFGYFQNRYFLAKHQDEIAKLGKRLHDIYQKEKLGTVVHVRLGDSNWAIDNSYYYFKVRDLIRDMKDVMVVTDSEEDSIRFFNNPNLKIISSKSAIQDFGYMVSAKKLICAPSTFSWWAAHSLSINAEVVMPSMLIDRLGVYLDKKRVTII